MRVHIGTRVLLPSVSPNQLVGIMGPDFISVNLSKPLERIDGNDNISSASVWLSFLVTTLQVVEDTGLQENNLKTPFVSGTLWTGRDHESGSVAQ